MTILVPLTIAASCAIAIWFIKQLLVKQPLPNVPFLRICDKPGVPGDKDDVQAFLADSYSALMKGYRKYNQQGKHFLLRTPKQVFCMVAPSHIDEIRKAAPTKLSHKAAGNTIFQTSHTLHPALQDDQSHFQVVSRALTPALNTQLMDLVDEAKIVFSEQIGEPKEWKNLNTWQSSFGMLGQVTNRLLATKELCRDPEFVKWSASYSKSIFGGAVLVRNYPKFLRTLAMYWWTDVAEKKATARKYFMPIIKERLQAEALYKAQGRLAEWNKIKSQDSSKSLRFNNRNPEILLYKAMHLNVTGVHTPCVVWVELIHDLCRHPEIHDELRDEIAEVFSGVADGKWTKENLIKLVKLDSFIRESSRCSPLSAVKLERYAQSEYTLSDGTVIPKGSSVAVVAQGIQQDADRLPNPELFDAFRYARLRAEPGQENNWQWVTTSEINLLFGHGKFACPGRHVASAVEKIMMVLALAQYDIRFVPGAPATNGQWTQKFRNPDANAVVQWKVRARESRFANILGPVAEA
ncbi:cytochrome P450 [Pyrenochaeta sp. DS3sAY3a]|nr:cytochrome P450 [Pyrenochaeta sp. DS3sAY3a]